MKEVYTIATTIFLLILVAMFHKLLYGYVFRLSEDKRNEEEKQDEIRILQSARIFFIISWLSVCFLSAISLIIFDVESSSDLENIIFSFVLLYGGFTGLVAKMGLLKITLSPTSKLYYLINIVMIIFGNYMLFNFILN